MVEFTEKNTSVDPNIMVAKQVFGEKKYTPEEAKELIRDTRERLRTQVFTRDLTDPKNENARAEIEHYMDEVVVSKKDKQEHRAVEARWNRKIFLQTLSNLNEYFFQMLRNPGGTDMKSRQIQEDCLRWHNEFANWIYSQFAKTPKSPSMTVVYTALRSVRNQGVDIQALPSEKKGNLLNLYRCIIQDAILSGLLEVDPREQDRATASIDPASIVNGMKAAIKVNAEYENS